MKNMEKKKTEGNAWGYLVGLGTVITFVSIGFAILDVVVKSSNLDR